MKNYLWGTFTAGAVNEAVWTITEVDANGVGVVNVDFDEILVGKGGAFWAAVDLFISMMWFNMIYFWVALTDTAALACLAGKF